MDRAEGALQVAERALSEARSALADISQIRNQFAEASRLMTVEVDKAVSALPRLLRDALSAGGEAGGIDVVAPWEVAAEMSAAISMLAEPVSKGVQPTVLSALSASPPRPRSFRFERNEQNVIIAAHEDYGP